MKWNKESFPAKTIDEITINSEEISGLENKILKYWSKMEKDLMANKVDKSYLISDVSKTIAVDSCQRKIPSEVLGCYIFSKYVVDPNKARFRKVIRIFAFVLRGMKRN